eukprot:10368449-Ditylum_brightwellii.AAC.1
MDDHLHDKHVFPCHHIYLLVNTLWSSASGQSTRDVVDFTYNMYVKRVLERTGKWNSTCSMKNMENGQCGTNIATTATMREIES